ncbi:DUF1553 domain-containing protein [Blastopirellula sp. J2-11]|uniref:DUF1553 domain-containing protein n=1 Tax=Blastopirellula sp. J2-11 TaxID=2943192 RepID=UPI0021C5BEFB|nr:DUF1553 domain-containing protein [Blastopirellula sp. J2-11]UUO08726.1 DUF1553 domain-containing protein [Blastopirellula sp. J2-11]
MKPIFHSWIAIAISATMGSATAAGLFADEQPVAFWEFGPEEQTPLHPVGGIHRDVPGPRPPRYPDFLINNASVNFDGSGSRFVFDDPGDNSAFDFTNGDEITLEAWVNIRDLDDGDFTYIIGKGRTGRPGFSPDNQNWAMRISGIAGEARPSFLFATVPAEPNRGNWHRYTSLQGFRPRTGWHHIAIAYRFGEPNTMQTWIDGKKIEGQWDAGGPTTKTPVTDNDQIWIGSALGGSPGNSFRGGLDSIAIHRVILDEQTLKTRFRRVGEEPEPEAESNRMPELGPLPTDKVTVTFHEGLSAHDRWPYADELAPPAAMQWTGSALLLDQIPLKYDNWGIRTGWKAPVLVRMAADVALPPGKHTVLMRARGLAQAWIDGRLVTRSKPLTGAPHGEEPITPVTPPPAPGQRPAWHRCQEVFATIEITDTKPVRVVFDAIAGGKRFRAQPGELTLAIRLEGSDAFSVLRPIGLSEEPLPLTDQAVEAELDQINASISQMNDQGRHAAAANQIAYWKQRHQMAQAWLQSHPAPAIPIIDPKAVHPIDAFIQAHLDEVDAPAGGVSPAPKNDFLTKVSPILKSECFRCHGEKEKGGLSLASRELAMLGGDSGEAAIQPGDPHASEIINRLRSPDDDLRMPPTGEPLSEEKIKILEKWITEGAKWPQAASAPTAMEKSALIDDAAFVRRAYLDTVGVVPTEQEVRRFLQNPATDKREQLIDQLLEDPRWADNWMGYWLDLLAENPTLINASLNSTGPFRWYLYDSLRDNKPIDRMVSELLMMRGGAYDGGSAGFALAAQNDAPFAAKGHIVGTAFLGIELQCARCHDSPYHSTSQQDLYSLAAMFARKPVSVPKSSTVPPGFFQNKTRESLIQVTLKPGVNVSPTWPFAEQTGAEDNDALRSLMQNPEDSREKLATLITAPQNTRFSQVIANRLWRRLIGAGIVEPPHDWEGNPPSHPELLEWLGKELIACDYDLKQLTRVMMTSQLYQQEAVGTNRNAEPEQRLFTAPDRRRLTAEQIVDSLYQATGCEMDIEEMTLDPAGRATTNSRNTYGDPHRSWMLVSLSNERDRPSLTLPRAAAVAEMLTAFGWNADRQAPKTDREISPNVLQPAVMANSTLSISLTRAAHESSLANLAVAATSPESLLESLFLRFVSRPPTPAEQSVFLSMLRDGFADRLLPTDQVVLPETPERLPQVTWWNHVRNEANTIQQEHARRVRLGPPADPRLQPEWRSRYEDAVWSIANLREFVWMP